MTPKLKNIIIVVVLIGGLFFVYSTFFKTPSTSQTLIAGTNSLDKQRTIAETKVLGTQITDALLQIESLNLDRSIFDSNILKSLVDRSEPISPEPIGRKNPFAPLSDTSVNYNSGVAPYVDNENLEAGSGNLNVQFTNSTSTQTPTGTSTARRTLSGSSTPPLVQ